MKIENLVEVSRLFKIAENLQAAAKSVEVNEDKYKSQDVHESDPETNTGYSAHISLFSDGSGGKIDLSGCYIGSELVDAIKIVIENKFELVKTKIALYGVDVSNLKLYTNED